MKAETRKFNHNFTIEMLGSMPISKKQTLHNALNRNDILTTYYGLDYQTVTVYKEGWYIECEGCRSRFGIWVGDKDGSFEYGKKKPTESKLSKLYRYDPEITSDDFYEITKELF